MTCCLLLLVSAPLSEATIYTYNNSVPFSQIDYAIKEAFPSLPGLFGAEMEENTFYRARLQFIRDNAYLCQDESDAEERTHHDPKMGTFVLPPDYHPEQRGDGMNMMDFTAGNASSMQNHSMTDAMTRPSHSVPVALLAARGYCPFYNKAIVAESFGNAVQYLIVYNNNVDGEDVLVPMYSEYGSTRLILLSVTHRTGQALKKYIAAQSPEVIAAGGPLIGFNNLPPEGILTVEDLQNYVLSALGLFFMFVSLSGCVLIWIGRRQLEAGVHPASRIILVGASDLPGGAAVVPSSSSRRLLTPAQIQLLVEAVQKQKQQAGEGAADEAVGAASLTTVSHEDDCCAVCMEDFEPDADQSADNLSLPCGHLFHKDCVVPWLTERQAKCPLCKFDVADYLRQYQAEQGIAANGDGQTSLIDPANAVALWNPLTWLRYRSWTAVARAEEPSTAASDGSSSSTGSSVYDDEERQTVVIELAENSVTMST